MKKKAKQHQGYQSQSQQGIASDKQSNSNFSSLEYTSKEEAGRHRTEAGWGNEYNEDESYEGQGPREGRSNWDNLPSHQNMSREHDEDNKSGEQSRQGSDRNEGNQKSQSVIHHLEQEKIEESKTKKLEKKRQKRT